MWYQNICSALLDFVTKHVCVRQIDRQTDRWMADGQNYDSQDRDSIAASCGKNHVNFGITHEIMTLLHTASKRQQANVILYDDQIMKCLLQIDLLAPNLY